ncbi:unnamed protein product [Mycena citricolor]|uniref:Secreted protein n=1 Tax=Mycena citricolor TaxID=2018698 RepID=A0AAD2HAK8_9AGAR|nr:unnamed protein product [Mycena citricolor]
MCSPRALSCPALDWLFLTSSLRLVRGIVSRMRAYCTASESFSAVRHLALIHFKHGTVHTYIHPQQRRRNSAIAPIHTRIAYCRAISQTKSQA